MTGAETVYSLAIDLLSVLGTLVAFLAFFSALRFSKEWSRVTVRLFKALVSLVSLAALAVGVSALCLVLSGNLPGDLGAVGTSLFYTIGFAIICMLLAVAAMVYLTVVRG